MNVDNSASNKERKQDIIQNGFWIGTKHRISDVF